MKFSQLNRCDGAHRPIDRGGKVGAIGLAVASAHNSTSGCCLETFIPANGAERNANRRASHVSVTQNPSPRTGELPPQSSATKVTPGTQYTKIHQNWQPETQVVSVSVGDYFAQDGGWPPCRPGAQSLQSPWPSGERGGARWFRGSACRIHQEPCGHGSNLWRIGWP